VYVNKYYLLAFTVNCNSISSLINLSPKSPKTVFDLYLISHLVLSIVKASLVSVIVLLLEDTVTGNEMFCLIPLIVKLPDSIVFPPSALEPVMLNVAVLCALQ